MEVLVWQGDFGLPTAHPAGLSLLTHLKFAGKSLKITEKRNAVFTETGEFPILRHSNREFATRSQINLHLSHEEIDIDSELSPQQKAESFAYSQLVENSLRPCFEYAWWVDEHNYDETIRSWFAKTITFPFNFYYPGKFQKKAAALIDVIYDDSTYDKNDIHQNMYALADECLKCFSKKLGDNDFLFGKKPCSTDALLFGYLAPILKVPLKNPIISKTLRNNYSNLEKYVQRICQMFYQDYEERYLVSCKNKTPSQKTDPTKVEVDYAKHTLLAFIFASIAMLGYAHSNGLLMNTWHDDGSSYIFETDEDDP